MSVLPLKAVLTESGPVAVVLLLSVDDVDVPLDPGTGLPALLWLALVFVTGHLPKSSQILYGIVFITDQPDEMKFSVMVQLIHRCDRFVLIIILWQWATYPSLLWPFLISEVSFFLLLLFCKYVFQVVLPSSVGFKKLQSFGVGYFWRICFSIPTVL